MIDTETQEFLLLVLRVCLGLSFVVAGLSKVYNWGQFVSGVIEYDILPVRPARAVGLGLPWIELLLGVALLLGIAVPAAGLIAAALLTSFTVAVVANLRRGREISCNCFGMAGTSTISLGTVARNALLLAMAAGTVILGLVLIPLAHWDVPWASSPGLTTSFEQPLLVVLLVAWCVALVYLVESTVDSHYRLSRRVEGNARCHRGWHRHPRPLADHGERRLLPHLLRLLCQLPLRDLRLQLQRRELPVLLL